VIGSTNGYSILAENVWLEISGGTISGSVIAFRFGTVIDMRGGYIAGELDGGAYGIDGVITGGAIDGDLRMYNNDTSVRASLDIRGGLFGLGNTDPLWTLGGFQDLNVYGLDLMFQDGILSGHLRDGSYLNVGVEFTPYWTGEFNLYNVPEPGTLALMGIGLAGIGLARRRRSAERR
jgi:hypothetical protein